MLYPQSAGSKLRVSRGIKLWNRQCLRVEIDLHRLPQRYKERGKLLRQEARDFPALAYSADLWYKLKKHGMGVPHTDLHTTVVVPSSCR